MTEAIKNNYTWREKVMNEMQFTPVNVDVALSVLKDVTDKTSPELIKQAEETIIKFLKEEK